MEMNWEIYQFLGGVALGLVAGIGIGANAWHLVCHIFDWYKEEHKKIEGASCQEVYA